MDMINLASMMWLMLIAITGISIFKRSRSSLQVRLVKLASKHYFK